MRREAIEGQIFGKWAVISYAGCRNHKKSFYNCRCTGCGRIYQVRADKLKSGRSTKCINCARKALRKEKTAGDQI